MVYVGCKVIGLNIEGSGNDDESENQMELHLQLVLIVKGGIGGFLYLSIRCIFSFDGVIGAFAITSDVGNYYVLAAIGAMFVHSMTTIYLVRKRYARCLYIFRTWYCYAIGALAFIILASGTGLHIPEVITGLVGVAFVFGLLSLQFHIVKSNNSS